MDSDQKRAFIAVALSALVLFGWQVYFAPKFENKPQVTSSATVAKTAASTETSKGQESSVAVADSVQEIPDVSKTLTNKDIQLTLSNKLSLMDFKNPQTMISLNDVVGLESLSINMIGQDKSVKRLIFNFNEISDKEIEGIDPNHGVKFKGILDDSGKFNISLESSNPVHYQFSFHSKDKKLENNQIRKFLYLSQKVERFDVGDSQSGEDKVQWFGIEFNYHLFAVVLNNKELARFNSSTDGTINLDLVNPVNKVEGYIVFAKKNYDYLTSLGDRLNLSVDFGVFGIIAVPMLRTLQFFYKYVSNYGLAIILLTLLVRLITYPLQFKSYKSMKKMQKIQPELVKLREKFKDDPQRMQKETMELFKKAGANPLGGCFPLLLQMPIFFAFYQVLYNAIELVGAPFILWITDLSVKDPYYVLPVLMAISMLAQSKLNPSTSADPTQKKLMYLMPIIFFFIMKNLPAGLNLYIFVSTVFGIIQQLIVYKTTD